MAVCASCGTENPDGFRFCGGCGSPLAEAPAPREMRKVVTALFCDVTGSTALGEELDPETLRRVMNRYFEEMRGTIERHGGTVEKFIGDAVMAVFGIPRVNEDDALRAVRAAAEIRERLPAIAEEVGVTLRFRTGVNTGPVLTGEGENMAIGDAVNVAARLEQAAQPGEIVLGAETLGLVRDAVEVEALEPLALKGKSEPVAAYRLLSIDPSKAGVARRLDTTLVGRERELRLLRDAYDRAVDESGCHLFTLLGPAGVGKSRLIAELLDRVAEEATVLRGRCLHYGEGITFWPLVEAFMPLGGPGEHVIELLSTGGAAAPEELFWEVRRLLEQLAAERPVVLYIDDVQWAEPMLVDALDHIADLSRGAPILLLCSARPELLEDRPGWGGGKLNATTVLLEPLGEAECEALLDELGDGLDPESRERVIAASQGNPLFLEEMVALAGERGTVAVPPTIQALLAARLERLGSEERQLLERGAVEGEVFHRLAVLALADGLAPEVETRLVALVRKELIRPHPAALAGDEAFRFRHLLIRDAAYDGLPKATRAELHQRFAQWLESAAADLVELDEIAGWHYEQAVAYRRELGQDVGPALARRAAEHLWTAGVRAGTRNDVAAARKLLERAQRLIPDGDPLGARIGVALAEQLLQGGDLAAAEPLLDAAERDPEQRTVAQVLRMDWLIAARPREAIPYITEHAPGLIAALEAAGDDRWAARAHLAMFMSYWLGSMATPAAECARRAVEHARRSGDAGLHAWALGYRVGTLIHGPFDAATMERELDEIAAEDAGPVLSAWLDLGRGELAILQGSLDEARELIERSREGFRALGMHQLVGAAGQSEADIGFAAGDPARALADLQVADATLAELGERSYRSTTVARMAQAHALLGRRAEAEEAIALAHELSADEDVINFMLTDYARADLALRAGQREEAERWARSSVDHALQTDFPVMQALALLELGRITGDRATVERALELYTARGHQPGIAEAREALTQL